MNAATETIGGAESPPKSGKNTLLKVLLAFVVLAGWIWILNWLLCRYQHVSYWRWFLKNGSLISAAAAFFALVSDRFEDKGLLSLNPLRYAASCMATVAIFFMAVANNLGPRSANERSAVAELWDMWFGVIMDLLMALAMLGWFLVVAPGSYVLTMFTGAPARAELGGGGGKLFVKREGSLTRITEQPSTTAAPDGGIDLSFGSQAFALTNALNAIVLYIAEQVVAHAVKIASSH